MLNAFDNCSDDFIFTTINFTKTLGIKERLFMKQLFIIHGYQASTNSHWFQWLADKMAKYGYKTRVL